MFSLKTLTYVCCYCSLMDIITSVLARNMGSHSNPIATSQQHQSQQPNAHTWLKTMVCSTAHGWCGVHTKVESIFMIWQGWSRCPGHMAAVLLSINILGHCYQFVEHSRLYNAINTQIVYADGSTVPLRYSLTFSQPTTFIK